jgi:hypothetical protein
MILVALTLCGVLIRAQQQCVVFVNNALGTDAPTCGGAVGAAACKTFVEGINRVNALTSADLAGCEYVTMDIAAGKCDVHRMQTAVSDAC